MPKPKNNHDTEKKILEVIVMLREFVAERKHGNIQINIVNGNILVVSVNETFKM